MTTERETDDAVHALAQMTAEHTMDGRADGQTDEHERGEWIDSNPWCSAASATPPSSSCVVDESEHASVPASALVMEPKFLVDAMMGRLLRWLRVLGIDSLLRDEGETLSSMFARAKVQQRTPPDLDPAFAPSA